jgi:hypothetical protein
MSSSIDAATRTAPGVLVMPAEHRPYEDMVWVPGG